MTLKRKRRPTGRHFSSLRMTGKADQDSN